MVFRISEHYCYIHELNINRMNKIKERLTELGMSQNELARALGVSKGTTSSWCNNLSQPPVSRILKLCEVLSCEISDLLVSPTKKK